jgi:hypothetical protein
VGDEWQWMNGDRSVKFKLHACNVIWQKLTERSETSVILKDLAEAGQPGHHFKPRSSPTRHSMETEKGTQAQCIGTIANLKKKI